MKFKMNNHEWEIIEESKQVVKEKYEDATKEETIEVFGLTNFCEQKIYINKDMHKDLKRHTLMHELLHCYIAEYCSIEQNNYNEEALCDICANSHDMIHKIVEEYFKPKVNIECGCVITPDMMCKDNKTDIRKYSLVNFT